MKERRKSDSAEKLQEQIDHWLGAR